jgi:hypothetical protein
MRRLALSVALVVIVGFDPSGSARGEQGGHVSHGGPQPTEGRPDAPDVPVRRELPSLPILVRPATLASQIGELAGHSVRVPYARVVGVFNPRVFLVDTATRLPPLPGNRARVLVLIEPGELRVTAEEVVASTVTVVGVARTLLGMRVAREVPWPTELRQEEVDRLEIRAAILAMSVQTQEGIELTGR